MVDLRVVGHALAGIEEWQRELVQRQLRALVEQPHDLGRVDHRAAAHRDQQIGTQVVEHLGAAADHGLRRFGLHFREDVDADPIQVRAHVVCDTARLCLRIRHEQGRFASELAEVVDCPRVEVGVRRHAEPLRGAWRRDTVLTLSRFR